MSLSPFGRGCLLAFTLVALAYTQFVLLERAYIFNNFRFFAERESEYAHENNTTSSPWMLIPPSLSELSHQASIGTRWVTLLDASVSSRAFKRHMFTKHQNRNIAWLEMSILATPGAPEKLLTWAKDLGVMIHPVPSLTCKNTTAPASQRHHMARIYAWCLTGGPVVFTRAHTLILRDLRQFESRCSSDVAYCGPGAFENLPTFEIDSGIFMARPHEAHCQALRSMAENSTQHPQDCEKGLLNSYFDTVNRTVLDFRYNAALGGKKNSVQTFANAIVAQYEPPQEARLKREEAVRVVLESTDRAFDRFEAVRAGRIPRRVIYATILTPAPKGYTHSTTPEAFKAHHVSKFVNGKIPWENHAIIYTENAFPEYRAWLKARGGHIIKVPPLFCENGRDKRYKYQFTKLQMWNLTEWDTIVYTDLDTLVTGDISQLWQSCPDGVDLCGAAESFRLPDAQYINGGLLLARPSKEFYRDLIAGRETYKSSTYLCEQDYLNYFLTEQRIGIVDPKYNIMSFDKARTVPYEDARLIHSKKEHEERLKFAVTEEDRSFIDRERKSIARLVSDFD